MIATVMNKNICEKVREIKDVVAGNTCSSIDAKVRKGVKQELDLPLNQN